MKKLLIICKPQFGYLTDSYKWCQYLQNEYDITYLCMDALKEKVKADNINVVYVSGGGPRLLRGIKYILTCIWKLLFFNGKILVVYFDGCAILKYLFPRKCMLLDVRTLSVVKDDNVRNKFDRKLIKTCNMYDALTIISEGVKNTINSRVSKQYILPLGADIISFSPKTYETLNIIYVGTLDNRDIYKTIEGIYLFQLDNPDVSLHYDIIGDGEEYRLLEEYIKKYSLELTVSLHGWVPNSKIKPFIEKASYGVAFVPINPYYEDQPSTKIYEYALSGIYVIATNTRSNREIINANNGILIEDTPIAVKNALEYIVLHKNNINESSVRESLKEYLWKDIVDKKLKPIIDLL